MRTVICAILALLCASVCADVVVLKDGTRVEGDLKRTEGGYDVTGADGKGVHVLTNNIRSIEIGRSTSTAAQMDRLASLKRSVESIDDINAIIGRFNSFIQQYKNTPAAAEAEKELAIWQERLDKKMVKVGGKWVTAEEQEQLLAQSSQIVQQALDLMKANRLKEAEPVLKQALDVDPNNPVANYLMGVILFRGDKLVPARKAFEIARAQVPSDAATINNIAVIAWRQNQFINALGFYSDAMIAMPANKEILNNVAEALYALKDDFRKNPAAQRTSRLFIEQEAKLEAVMAQYGWYRWGSMWLDQNQLNELKKGEKESKDKLDALQKQFDDLQKKYNDNEASIRQNDQYMIDLSNNRQSYQDPVSGQIMIAPYPQSYYDAGATITRLKSENKTIGDTLGSLRAAAQRLDASKPKPKYTGVQQLIGAEGAPRIAGVTNPTTVPTTQPTTPTPAPVIVPTTQPAVPAAPVPAPPVPSTPVQPVAPAAPTTKSVF